MTEEEKDMAEQQNDAKNSSPVTPPHPRFPGDTDCRTLLGDPCQAMRPGKFPGKKHTHIMEAPAEPEIPWT